MNRAKVPAFRALQVFICHASEDKPAAIRLCEQLEAEGVECWFDLQSLSPGMKWEQEIERAIRRSDAVLVLLSRTAVAKTSYLRTEMKLVVAAAAARPRPSSFVFPVKLEPCQMPAEFSPWQAADLSSDAGISGLLGALRELAAALAVGIPGDSAHQQTWRVPRGGAVVRDIVASTRDYERWLRRRSPVVSKHFQMKHLRMSVEVLPFMRATYYRWAEVWPCECPDTIEAPMVLSAGDVHLQSFSTWLDPAGRMGWGLAFFDEAYPLPYTNDLVRLATSIALLLDTEDSGDSPPFRDVCQIILDGYLTALEAGGLPFVLGYEHTWLSRLMGGVIDPRPFWARVHALPTVKKVPAEVREAIERALPPESSFHVLARTAGTSSLGRPRYVGLTSWRGGPLAVEARYVPWPASAWAAGRPDEAERYHNQILNGARRTPDPGSGVWKGVFVHSLSPQRAPNRIWWAIRKKDISRLVKAFAGEVANVHLGTPGAQRAIRADLERRPRGWLRKAARVMAKRTVEDFKEWRRHIKA
jgi:hypothetical protein